jgi:hypothetical protein
MPLTESAKKRLAGLWGSYDFSLIRDKHFVTASDLVERFLEHYEGFWPGSHEPLDHELARKPKAVRVQLAEWAQRKLDRVVEDESVETIRAHIMFKELHYGRGHTISFGARGLNWKRKTEIAAELALYRPWSIEHAMAVLGGRARLHRHMRQIVERSGSPSELGLFDAWWNLTQETDRPMLFPQVQGHTSGKFWQKVSDDEVIPMHFDFGLVNVTTRAKALMECDSRRYHSQDQRYQADRDRQNIAEREGWSVRRFTYEDITGRVEYCLDNLCDHLFYK